MPSHRQLRVLFPFHGNSVGGSHISTLTLIRQLSQQGIQPVVAVHEHGLLTHLLESEGVPWVSIPQVSLAGEGSILGQLRQSLHAASTLSHFLAQHNIDLVHTNDDVMHLTWMAAAHRHGSPHLWHLRTVGMSRRRAVFAALFRSKFCTISAYCLESYPKYVKNRCPTITNPIQVSESPEQKDPNRAWLVNQLNLPPDQPIVGWVGNFTVQKRPLQFLEIARRVIENQPMSFVLVGERRQPCADKVDAFIQQHRLQRWIHQVGTQLPADRWISAFDVLVATARSEGLGRTLLEAMAMSTPVVASADGGHLEVIDHNATGLLVPPSDCGAYVRALQRLLNEPEFTQKLVRDAMRHVEKNYTVSAHAIAVSKIYSEISVS